MRKTPSQPKPTYSLAEWALMLFGALVFASIFSWSLIRSMDEYAAPAPSAAAIASLYGDRP